jgi:membrane protease YdiL (CAAX protease family)
MRIFIKKNEIILFSIFSILFSFLAWKLAIAHEGTVKLLLTQLGYFIPAIIAIVIVLLNDSKTTNIRHQSLLPFLVILICIVVFTLLYGADYYHVKINILISDNPLIIVLISLAFIYFVYQFIKNKEKTSIDTLVRIPKTNIAWYIGAILFYPFIKYIGVILSVNMFPDAYQLPSIGIIMLVPLFLFSVIFYAAIGEEVGWRGYLLRKLQFKFNPFVATLYIAIIWSVWHVGYFMLVERYTIHQIPGVILWTIMASFFATWLFNKTKGNVLILILFHASINLAIVFVAHPAIIAGIHFILLVFVLITGKFFKKINRNEFNYD